MPVNPFIILSGQPVQLPDVNAMYQQMQNRSRPNLNEALNRQMANLGLYGSY